MGFFTTVHRDLVNWDLQRTFNFEVMLPDVAGIPGYTVSKYCQAARFGDYDIATLSEIRYGAFRAKYVGFFEIKPLTLTFLCPTQDVVLEYLKAWRGLERTDNGFYGVKSSYAKTIHVMLHDRAGNTVDQFTFYGTFPKNMPEFNLTYKEESVVEYDITFNVDRVK